jgi:hypothetical protein
MRDTPIIAGVPQLSSTAGWTALGMVQAADISAAVIFGEPMASRMSLVGFSGVLSPTSWHRQGSCGFPFGFVVRSDSVQVCRAMFPVCRPRLLAQPRALRVVSIRNNDNGAIERLCGNPFCVSVMNRAIQSILHSKKKKKTPHAQFGQCAVDISGACLKIADCCTSKPSTKSCTRSWCAAGSIGAVSCHRRESGNQNIPEICSKFIDQSA